MNPPKREPYTAEQKRQHRERYREYKDKLKAYQAEYDLGEWRNKPFNEFLDLVIQREDPELHPDHTFCPHCHSENIHKGGTTSTLVGSYGEFDCNHKWTACQCRNCGLTFTQESKGHEEALPRPRYNVWYTKDGRILRGIPTCFESYIYTCRHCGGDVKRHYHNPGSREDQTITTFVIGEGLKQEVWYRCDGCHAEVKCSNEYFRWNTPHEPRRPFRPRLRLGWVIQEEVGIAVINDYAIRQIEFADE